MVRTEYLPVRLHTLLAMQSPGAELLTASALISMVFRRPRPLLEALETSPDVDSDDPDSHGHRLLGLAATTYRDRDPELHLLDEWRGLSRTGSAGHAVLGPRRGAGLAPDLLHHDALMVQIWSMLAVLRRHPAGRMLALYHVTESSRTVGVVGAGARPPAGPVGGRPERLPTQRHAGRLADPVRLPAGVAAAPLSACSLLRRRLRGRR